MPYILASGAVCGCPPRVRTRRELHRGHMRRPAYRRLLFAAFAAARMAVFPVLSSALSKQGQQRQPALHRGPRHHFMFPHLLEPDRHAIAHAVLLGRYGDGKAATMAAADKLFHPLAFAKAEGTGLWVSSSAASILDLNVSRQRRRLPASFPRWFAETLSSGSC